MSSDTLSEVLRAVRLSGAAFFDVKAHAPFAAEAPPAKAVASRIMPEAEHVIEYHLVTRGSCWAGIVDQPPVELGPGDIVCFPQGDPHVISSAPGLRGKPDLASYEQRAGAQLPFVVTVGESGADTHLICGFLGCDVTPFNPLLATLPRVLCVRTASAGGASSHLVQLALEETQARRPGGECVLARLSELLFIEAVRHYVATQPVQQTGFLAGLRDDLVGRALAKLHERPAYPWSLEGLASELGISRSVLADRFMQLVGVPPMHYLAQWRMQLAAGLLAGTEETLATIAERVGYGSEAALSRAFKRLVGVAPALWRQGQRPA